LRPLLSLIFVAIGVFGAIQHFRRDRKSFWYIAILFATLSFGLTFYLNFRYGYSIPLDVGQDSREVRERDYFFIVSFSIWGIWVGIGLAALWQWLGTRMNDAKGLAPTSRPPLAAAAVLVFALLPFVLNFSWANRRYDYSARDWAYNLLMSVEPYGVLFTNGDNDTFPLWYAQEVEDVRKDVTVIVMSYLNTPWYVKQLKDLTAPCAANENPAADETRIICQRPYEEDKGPAFYRGSRAPTKSILATLTEQQIEQIAGTAPFMMQSAQLFAVGNIQSVIPQGEVMLPADLFLGYIITTALQDRPIYFASTTQAYEELNLGNQILRQGVAYKLINGPLQPDLQKGIIPMPAELQPATGPLIDLPRTAALVDSVFVHHPGFPDDFGAWVDGATQQIPMYYGYTHYGLAQAYATVGDTARSNYHLQQGERFLALGRR
jgi:hypothetical protein